MNQGFRASGLQDFSAGHDEALLVPLYSISIIMIPNKFTDNLPQHTDTEHGTGDLHHRLPPPILISSHVACLC